jgi:hypothetical protein
MRPATAVCVLAALVCAGGCRTAAPSIRFVPAGTDLARLRSEYALTDAERRALTPESLRRLTQEQVDQIYQRAYFRERFALNFTLLDPAVGADAPMAAAVMEDCDA